MSRILLGLNTRHGSVGGDCGRRGHLSEEKGGIGGNESAQVGRDIRLGRYGLSGRDDDGHIGDFRDRARDLSRVGHRDVCSRRCDRDRCRVYGSRPVVDRLGASRGAQTDVAATESTSLGRVRILMEQIV